MKNKERVRTEYRDQRIAEVEVILQRLFTPVPAPLPCERVIIVGQANGTRLVRRVIES